MARLVRLHDAPPGQRRQNAFMAIRSTIFRETSDLPRFERHAVALTLASSVFWGCSDDSMTRTVPPRVRPETAKRLRSSRDGGSGITAGGRRALARDVATTLVLPTRADRRDEKPCRIAPMRAPSVTAATIRTAQGQRRR
jgi:hypothetical protein